MSHGYVESGQKDALAKQLRRIEGQVRGVQRMVEDERYCIDVLTQIAAVTASLEDVALKLTAEHVRHCVRDGGDEKVDELLGALRRLVKSR
jgi:DNA-binding FrmR family transcriptional regulator